MTSDGRIAGPASSAASRAGAPAPASGTFDPKRRDLKAPASTEEEASLAREIGSIIQTIRLRRGRRFRKGPRGKLWMKRVIRDSLAHGGVPFELPMKERRPRMPRIVLLVDVSYSVARASGLFLLICHGLRERLRRVQILLFVDRIIDGTDLVRTWTSGRAGPPEAPPAGRRVQPGSGVSPRRGGASPQRGGASFADLLGSIPDLNVAAPSDYGRAFYQARGHLMRDRDAVLVILGDARSNRRDPLVWAFEEIAERCRRVIWLNPESRSLWDTGDSVMDAYIPSCDVVCETRDLAGLARGVREILRAL